MCYAVIIIAGPDQGESVSCVSVGAVGLGSSCADVIQNQHKKTDIHRF